MNYKLILSSASPRRRELIKYIGLPYECISVDADESVKCATPSDTVMEISLRKARAALEVHKLESDEVIIGADTIVVIDDSILGKPIDKADGINMLQKLQGRAHKVYTGVTFIYMIKNTDNTSKLVEKTFYEATDVIVSNISEEDIKKYISTNEYADKAGSYAIQGEFSIHISGINGDYNNVVGFPVSRIYKELQNINTCE